MLHYFHFTNETDKRITMWIKDVTSLVINTKWGSFDPGESIPPWQPEQKNLFCWMEYWASEKKIATTGTLSVAIRGKMVRLLGSGGNYRVEVTDYYDWPHFRLVNSTPTAITCWVRGSGMNSKFSLAANLGEAYAMPDYAGDNSYDLEFWDGNTKVALAEGYKLKGYQQRVATLTKSGDTYSVAVT